MPTKNAAHQPQHTQLSQQTANHKHPVTVANQVGCGLAALSAQIGYVVLQRKIKVC